MSLASGSRANVRGPFEMLEVIQSTRFETLPSYFSALTVRAASYHSVRTGTGWNFIYDDPWTRMKIDEQRARSRAAAARVVPQDVPIGWVHVEKDTPRTPRNALHDYVPVQVNLSYGSLPQQQDNHNVGPTACGVIEPVEQGLMVSSGGEGFRADNDVVVVRKFIEDAGALSASDASMSFAEMRGYVCRRMAR